LGHTWQVHTAVPELVSLYTFFAAGTRFRVFCLSGTGKSAELRSGGEKEVHCNPSTGPTK
jgi:hypothetical protein